MTDNFNISNEMFSSSSLSEYMGCPRSFYWTWIRRLESKDTKQALVFGTTFHEALKEWYTNHDLEKALSEFDKMSDVITKDIRTKEWGKAIFQQYVERYGKESSKTLHLEVKFRIDIGKRLYAGTIDRIVKWTGGVNVEDHKTTKQLGLSFFNSYRPNPQIDGYCYACRELVGECEGAIINGISVAENPKERFMRVPSPRTKAEIDSWPEQFTLVTDDIMRDYERGKWRMNTSNCNRYGECKYKHLCIYGDDDKWIAQNFNIVPVVEEKKEVTTV